MGCMFLVRICLFRSHWAMKTKQRQKMWRKRNEQTHHFSLFARRKWYVSVSVVSSACIQLIERRSSRKRSTVTSRATKKREKNGDKNNVHLYVIILHDISLSITMVSGRDTGILWPIFNATIDLRTRFIHNELCVTLVRLIFAYRTANTDCPFKNVAGVN